MFCRSLWWLVYIRFWSDLSSDNGITRYNNMETGIRDFFGWWYLAPSYKRPPLLLTEAIIWLWLSPSEFPLKTLKKHWKSYFNYLYENFNAILRDIKKTFGKYMWIRKRKIWKIQKFKNLSEWEFWKRANWRAVCILKWVVIAKFCYRFWKFWQSLANSRPKFNVFSFCSIVMSKVI